MKIVRSSILLILFTAIQSSAQPYMMPPGITHHFSFADQGIIAPHIHTLKAKPAQADRSDTSSPPASDSARTETPVEKRWGVEWSPLRLVLGWLGALGGTTHLSGSLSFFAADRHAEISFPVLYVYGVNDHVSWQIVNIDGTYRRFLGEHQSGIYLSAGIRYSYASGAEVLARNVHTANSIVQNRFGVYGGLGFRHFWRSGFYYGANIVFGRYFGDRFRFVGDSDIDTGPVLVDSELLKIGYAF